MEESYAESALRHSVDADRLACNQQFDGAGYLIGYAVECAIKHAIREARQTTGAQHGHLPDLIGKAMKVLQGRRPVAIFKLLNERTLMRGWQIELRYAGNGAVAKGQFENWRLDANRVLGAASLKRTP